MSETERIAEIEAIKTLFGNEAVSLRDFCIVQGYTILEAETALGTLRDGFFRVGSSGWLCTLVPDSPPDETDQNADPQIELQSVVLSALTNENADSEAEQVVDEISAGENTPPTAPDEPGTAVTDSPETCPHCGKASFYEDLQRGMKQIKFGMKINGEQVC